MRKIFKDRKDAGARLARALADYRNQNVLVLAIPRGGVEVGYEVARYLDSDFSIVVTRKLPFPDNPEAGFGAIAEDGSRFIFRDAARSLPPPVVERIVEQQQGEIKRRIRVLRGGGPLPEIADRTVILVDDGIAMGSTMRASIQLCKKQGAGKIVVATPVAGQRVAQEIEAMVDRVVVLTKPAYFRAVAQVYQDWYDVPDAEVLEIMEQWRKERASGSPLGKE
jgi:putative phosphoribosyl transferase